MLGSDERPVKTRRPASNHVKSCRTSGTANHGGVRQRLAGRSGLPAAGWAAAFTESTQKTNHSTHHATRQMPTLAPNLRLTHYFTLAFGAQVGFGWLVPIERR